MDSRLIIGIIVLVAILGIVGVLASGILTDANSDVSGNSSQSSNSGIENNSTAKDIQSKSSSSSTSGIYWASTKTDTFHVPSCSGAKKINETYKIVFYSRDEAIESGWEPCKTCNP